MGWHGFPPQALKCDTGRSSLSLFPQRSGRVFATLFVCEKPDRNYFISLLTMEYGPTEE